MNKSTLVTQPAALRRDQAAAHMGVCAATLDKLVSEGIIPPPRALGGIKRYARADLDAAIAAAPFADEFSRASQPRNPDELLG